MLKQNTDTRPFNERLIDWRKRNNWTQRQAADFLGAGLSTFQHWEQKQQKPRGATLRAVELAMRNGQQTQQP